MKNKAIDLHNILFEQLERLNDLTDEEINTEKMISEIQRAEAINKTAAQLIANGRLVLDAIKVQIDAPEKILLPDMLSSVKTTAIAEPLKVKK